MELEMLADINDGNVADWFDDTLEETKDKLKSQKKHLENLQKGIVMKSSKKEDGHEGDDPILDEAPARRITANIGSAMSFHVFDEALQNCLNDKVKYS